MQTLFPLRNSIRDYAWGSTTAIAALLGQPPAASPQAELWLGAHPSAPSEVLVDSAETGAGWQPMQHLVREHGEQVLGPDVARRWRELPFLFKVLAAARPLSIQAHPDAEQARRGFAAEEAAGIPRDAAERNYPDDRHKPELIYALSEFTVLRGFREPHDIRRRFERLGLGDARLVSALDGVASRVGLQAFLRSWLLAEPSAVAAWVSQALATLQARSAADEAESWLPRLAAEYGRDRGVLAPLFLHVFRLAPGEALYTGAGVLHAYLEGVGIEVMASSDNVLRGALTQKHVDPEALANVVRYEPEAPELTPGNVRGGEVRFDAPADEFRLSRLRPEGKVVAVGGGVQILLCTEGEGEILTGAGPTPIRRGDSFLVPHATGGFELAGLATVFRASVGRAQD